MTHFILRLILILFFVLLTGCAHNMPEQSKPEKKNQPSARVVEYGIYELVKKGRLEKKSETNTGIIYERPVLTIKQKTDRIPVKKGTYFGFKVVLNGLRGKHWVDLTKVLIHPVMTRNDGTTSTGSKRLIRSRVSSGSAVVLEGYGLQEDYELVEGDWIFQLWYDNRILVEQRFQTVSEAGRVKQ